MKFKIGNRVRVVKILNQEELDYSSEELLSVIHATGTITEIDELYHLPYTVKFDSNEINNLDMVLWCDAELVLLDENIDKIELYKGIDSIIEQIEEEEYHTFDDIIKDLKKLKKLI